MRKKLLPLFAILLIVTAIPIQAAANTAPLGRSFLSEYVQTLYDEDSTVPVSQVKSALQTRDGFMWFAGYQGLMRYDGMATKLFTAEDGFPSYNVNVLYEDIQNRLWVGTNDNGIALYEGNAFKVYGITEGLPSASVRGISGDENGTICVSTTSGIAFISPDGTLLAHPALSSVFSTQLAYIGGGHFICLMNDGAIVLFNKTDIIKTYESNHFGAEQPLSLFISEDGDVYIGTVGGTVYITNPAMSQYKTLTIPSLQTLNRFYEDSGGRVWVCADNGLGYISGETFTPVDGLQMNNSIECIYEDYEGSFWVCSSRQGLLQLTHGKFTNISFVAGLPDYTVNTTAVFNGDLYIGADEGLVVLRDYAPVHNELTDMLGSVRIRCMLTDSKGQLWICTYENYGVVLVKKDGIVVSLNEENGLAGNKVRCIIEAKNGDMLVGMSGGVSVIRNEKVIKSYTKNDGLTNDVILSLAEDQNGIIYAGSDGGGIYAIDGDTVQNYTEKDGLAAGIILRLTFINNGLWVSTGNAVCYMDDTGIRMIEKLTAYDDNVFDIKQVGDNIWFLHTKGINICNIQNLMSADDLIMTQLLKRDGLLAPVTANSWNALTGDGMLYVSTGKGVLCVNTENVSGSETAPLAAVSEVYADGSPVGLSGELTISDRTRRVDLHISLLSFASKDGTVSYMLEGFDSESVTVSRDELSWISYTNLKGGRYTFHLYGTNAAGVQSETVTLIINKEYTLLEIPLVRVLLLFLGIGVLVLCVKAFILHRTKAIIRQRQEYKEITGQIMSVAADMSDSRNECTRGHSHRVADYSKLVGKRLGMSEEELETLYYAAILHDIGKTSVSDVILDKEGPLTKEEFDAVKSHVTIGGELLRGVNVIADVALGAKYHHERIDGKGYAEGLSGSDIPMIARIIGVCNAFDSMLSDRPYRKAMTLEKAQSELIRNAGTQFDEKVTAILISLINEESVPL